MAVKIMIRKIALIMLSFLLVANSGCTSLQTMKPTQASIVEHKLEVGDKVRIYYRDYRTEDVRIVKMSESKITGTRKDGTVVAVDWRDIYTLEVKKVHLGKTAVVVVGGAAAVVGAIVIYGLAIYVGISGG